jgi:hypothetical protein
MLRSLAEPAPETLGSGGLPGHRLPFQVGALEGFLAQRRPSRRIRITEERRRDRRWTTGALVLDPR